MLSLLFKELVLFCLFLAGLGLHCCTGFSLVVANRGCSSCRVQASHCGGFSCCGAQALGHTGSVVVVPQL